MSKSMRIGLFGSLYFAQGMLMSYFLTFNILYLNSAGYSEGEVGIFQAVLTIPFVLKILLGMMSDGVSLFGLGHRKPYILVGLIGQIVAMGIAPMISISDGLGGFVLVAFAASISMALYDTCTDGLAMDTTPEDERGIIQGVMVGARAAGILLMLVVGGWLVDQFGWPAVFYSVSAISVLPALLLVLSGVRESDDFDSRREPFQWAAFKSFGSMSVVLLAVLGFIYTISLDGILTFLSSHLFSGYQLSVGGVGLLLALSMVGRILGALSNSWITDKIGDKQSLMVAIGLATLACMGLGFEYGVVWIGIFGFLFGLAYGYYSAVYAAVAMKLSRPEIAASMFAIFMTFLNIGTVGGQAFGGMLTEELGFGVMALILGALNLVNIPIVLRLFKKKLEVQSIQ